MIPFLQLVANDLYQKFGNELHQITLIFPNKRAGLFFNEYLAACSDQPIWAPHHQTISELFRNNIDLTVCDPIQTICELYKSYCNYVDDPESLDFFYGWGEKMLNDFDDIDKNLVDAKALFRNLHAIKQLEDESYLNEQQEKVLADFFQHFSIEKNSLLKQKFLRLWEQMAPIYDDLNYRLKEQGLAYEGALYRLVVENYQPMSFNHFKKYVFVGFNVLNKVEERLFSLLSDNDKALFYWDYDQLYYNESCHFEAGVFLPRNLKRFPNELSTCHFDNFSKLTDIHYIAASTNHAQARYAGQWLQHYRTIPEKQTAIVICDETLLQPVLHSLPTHIEHVNVTKGFPLAQTPAYTLIDQFITDSLDPLQSQPSEQKELLAHLSCLIKEQAIQMREKYDQTTPSTNEQILSQLYTESYFQAYKLINRFYQFIEKGILSVNATTLFRLIRQVVRQTDIPYHGEPAMGVQLMGLLETRGLDFRHVLVLGVNEGNLPQKTSDSSFIPFDVRKAFGLTTPEHKTAVYAYYFYRLLQRAEHATLVYSDATNGMSKGEMSRFMTQLLIETSLPIQRHVLSNDIHPTVLQSLSIHKTKEMLQQMKSLSPSALNAYMYCQLQFYFQHIAKLKEPDPQNGVIEANTFGTLFHRSAELFYTELTSKNNIVTQEKLEQLAGKKGEWLIRYVRQAFKDEQITPQLVIEEVLHMYLNQLIENDKKLVPFEIVEMEKRHDIPYTVQTKQEQYSIRIGGFIDRLDLMQIPDETGTPITTLRVVDYKTGGQPETAKNMQELFTISEKRPHYIFQTFLYALTLCDQAKWPIAPALFFVHKSAGNDYNPYISFGGKNEKHPVHYVTNFQVLADEFREALTTLLEEIFNEDIPFAPTGTERACASCPYHSLCGK